MRKFRNSKKNIITGLVTDKIIHNGEYPNLYIYLDIEKLIFQINILRI